MSKKKFLKIVLISCLLGLSVGLMCQFNYFDIDDLIDYTPIMIGVSLGLTVLGCTFCKEKDQ